jgi:hypothetical protein
VSNNLRQIFLAILVGVSLLLLYASAQERAAAACTTADYKCKFGFRITDTIVGMGLFAFIGLFNVDGAGHITGTQSLAGVIYHDSRFAVTYTVRPTAAVPLRLTSGTESPNTWCSSRRPMAPGYLLPVRTLVSLSQAVPSVSSQGPQGAIICDRPTAARCNG